MDNRHIGRGSRGGRALRLWAVMLLLAMVALWLPTGSARAAAPIAVGCTGTAGDVAGLISAISQANTQSGADTISLAAGCTYALGAVNNSAGGPNGLPVISGSLTILGNGATIARSAGSPAFRILKNSGTLTLDGVTLAGGLASGSNGGAIYNTGSLTMLSSTVTGSRAHGSRRNGGNGGAIYNTGSLTVSASTLASNQALGGDGASHSGSLGGSGFGGAIFSTAGSSVTIINSTISGNQALGGPDRDDDHDDDSYSGAGGGIFSDRAAVTISSSTIYANAIQDGAHDHAFGGGVFAKGGSLSYRNSILLGNGSSDCAVIWGALSSLGSNLLAADGGCPSSGDLLLTEQSPGILPLANNGGPTLTHALAADSPAINAADSASCPPTDQRGVARPQGACDIGAFEYRSPVLDSVYTVTTDADDGDGSLRQAILDSNGNAGFDTIIFALPAGPQTISLASPLPAITDHVVIDATGQSGVTIDGAAAGTLSGLRINAGGSSVRGLGFTGFSGAGIEITSSNNTVESNIIVNNGGAGISVISGTGNSLRQNRISDNGGLGIDLDGDGQISSGPGAGANNLQPFPQISAASENTSDTLIAGSLATQPETSYSIDLYASVSCDTSGNGEGQTYLGSTDLDTNGSFSLSLPRTDLSGLWITAVATDDAGNSSEFSPCVPVNTNNLWTNAIPLSLQPTSNPQAIGALGATISQKITSPYQERWYRFPVTPGSRVRITLNGLPGSAITLHRDLPTIYAQLGNPQSAVKTSASNLPGTYLPGTYLPGTYLPGTYLPGTYLPGTYLPGTYLPGTYLPGTYLPGTYLPGTYLPGTYLPGTYLPGTYLPGTYLPERYAGAIFNSLMAVGAEPNVAAQTIERSSWDLSEDLYVRVVGPVDQGQSFSLSVTVEGGACASLESPPADMLAIDGGAPSVTRTSLIIWDSQRFAEAHPDNTTAQIAGLRTSLATFANRSEIGGEVIDLADHATYPRVAFARAQLQANTDCTAAANMVANEIKAVIDAHRGASLQYIVLVGGDESIPFFRYPDQAGLGNENEYYPPVVESSPSNASLRDGRVLGQDGYGASTTIWRGSYELPLPDLAVGRLVGDADTVSGMLATYAGVSGVVTPHSALVTGYDFVADGATAVSADLSQGLDTAPTDLIQEPGDATAWTAKDLGDLLLKQRHDLIFFTGHFDAGNMLAADYATSLPASDILSAPADFTNTILFGLGCHSGYNVPPPDAISGFSPSPDWPEAYAMRGASYIAATGYAYGDTELVEYGERYLVNLARELRTGSGPVALGSALIRAKQAYLSEKASISGMDEKTLLQFSLYGLPMLKVNMPGQRITAASSSVVSGTVGAGGPGASFGLQLGQSAAGSTEITVSSAPTSSTVTLTDASGGSVDTSYYSGGSGAVANPAEPILPLELRNVGVSGQVLRGVGFRSGSYSDLAQIIPLTSAPTTENSRSFTSFYSQTFYPAQPWSVNSMGDLTNGDPNLAAIVGQYRSNGAGTIDGTLRLFSSMGFRTYYLNKSWAQNTATREAGVAPAPQIREVTTERLSPTSVRVRVFAAASSSVDLQEVWITYTDLAAPGSWQSIDLTAAPGEPGYWEATANLTETAVFMAQAVSATGLVSLDTNSGAFYPVAQPASTTLTGTALSALSAPGSGTFGQPVSFLARLTDQDGAVLGNRLLRLTIGTQSAFASTDSAGEATVSIRLSQPAGSYTAQISFAGSPGYSSTSLALPFAIQKANSSLAISPAGPVVATGSNPGISAVLTGTGGAPIVDRSVIFIATADAGGSFGQTAKTGPSGRAILSAVSWPAGTYSLRASFAGGVPLPDFTLSDPSYTSSASGAVSLTIVNQPDTEISDGPSGTSGDTLVSFSFSGSGGVAPLSFACSLDGEDFAPCSSPASYDHLADGAHTFQVRAVDAGGVADPTPAERSWTTQVIYRATEQGEQIWIERNVALAGMGDYDGKQKDGWALVARTNGDDDDGDLVSFYVQGGVPYAIIANHSHKKGNRCILITPKSLAVVKKGQTRLMRTVAYPVPCPVN
ncbi:hypothetical protein EKD04_019885 [Chloroflexales bacterium ZM16-3]|nr:hypothetical protein [Chloroflexales bacterium ZM16-3]